MNHGNPYPTNNFDYDVDDDDFDFSDELSPSDGYFSQSSHVPQNMVVVPEEPESSRNKAQEAAEEAQQYRPLSVPMSPALTRNSIYTPSSSSRDHRSQSEFHEDTTSVIHDPPPLYEAATAGRQPPSTSPSSPLSPSGSRMNYNTINNATSITPNLQGNQAAPQSMADHPGDMYADEEANVPRSQQPRGRRGAGSWLFNRRTTGGRFRRFVLTMMGVLFAIMIVLTLVSVVQEDSYNRRNRSGPGESPGFGVKPSKGAKPHKGSSPSASSTLPSPSSSLPTVMPTPPSKPVESTPSRPLDPFKDYIPNDTRIIDDGQASISGKYVLQDSLLIRANSGSVSITVVIPRGWNAATRPATLDIATTSGSIHVDFVDIDNHVLGKEGVFPFHPSHDGSSSSPSVRPLNIKMQSVQGSISGNFLHGNSSNYTTNSGSISGKFFPISSSATNASFFSTQTTHGSQTIKIFDPILLGHEDFGSFIKPDLSNMYSNHACTGFGSINLDYPGSWSGSLDAEIGRFSSITATGPGLVLTEITNIRVKGFRGQGEGIVKVNKPGSGSLKFKCQAPSHWSDDLDGDDDSHHHVPEGELIKVIQEEAAKEEKKKQSKQPKEVKVNTQHKKKLE